MSEKHAASKQALEQLVRLLPRSAALALLQDVERGSMGLNARVDLLKDTLAVDLDARRPDKLRRAFTTQLEPFLVDDPWLAGSPVAMPGMVTRIDAGALWHATLITCLQHSPHLVTKLPGAETVGAGDQTEVIKRTTEFVAVQISDSMAEPSTAAAWRATFDSARANFARQADFTGPLHVIDENWFHWIASILTAGRVLSEPLADLRQAIAARKPGDSATAAADMSLMMAMRRRLETELVQSDLDPRHAYEVPALFLNVSRHYEAIGLYIANRAAMPDAAVARTALLGHVRALISYLDKALTGAGSTAIDRNLWIYFDAALLAYDSDIANVPSDERAAVHAALSALMARPGDDHSRQARLKSEGAVKVLGAR